MLELNVGLSENLENMMLNDCSLMDPGALSQLDPGGGAGKVYQSVTSQAIPVGGSSGSYDEAPGDCKAVVFEAVS